LPTVLPVSVDRTGPVAVVAGETRLADARAGPGVAHFGVVWIAAADQAAVWTVGGGIVAFPLVAVESLPPVRA